MTVYDDDKRITSTQGAFNGVTGASLPADTTPRPANDNGKRGIAFFLGNDITTLKIINHLVPQMIGGGYKPVLFLPKHKGSKKVEAHQAPVQDFAFYERYLLNNIIYPALERMPLRTDAEGRLREDLLYTPRQLAEYYGLRVEEVDNVNDPAFIKRIENDRELGGGISIRCYQIFHNDLIRAFREKTFSPRRGDDGTFEGFLWNLHPGKLPTFQGVFSPLFAMASLQRTAHWTLHEVVYDQDDPYKGIDQGPIITPTRRTIDYTRPAIHLYMDFAGQCASMLFDRLSEHFKDGVAITPQAEHPEQEHYYSYPSPDFFESEWKTIYPRLLEHAREIGFEVNEDLITPDGVPVIANPEEMLEFYRLAFVNERNGSEKSIRPQLCALDNIIESAIGDWAKNKGEYLRQHAMMHGDQPYGLMDYLIKNKKQLPNGFSIDPNRHCRYDECVV